MSDKQDGGTNAVAQTEFMQAESLIGSYNANDRGDVAAIKSAAKAFAHAVLKNCPDGRRKAIALTHIEEAAMIAVKGIFS